MIILWMIIFLKDGCHKLGNFRNFGRNLEGFSFFANLAFEIRRRSIPDQYTFEKDRVPRYRREKLTKLMHSPGSIGAGTLAAIGRSKDGCASTVAKLNE
jgi:hypothetical protein